MRQFARAIIEHDNKFLVIKEYKSEEHNIWTFAGGKKDDGETIDETCKREVFEELGLKIETQRLLCEGIYSFPCGDWYGYYYICTVSNINELQIKEISKCNGFCFLPLDEIVELPKISIPKSVLTELEKYKTL